jgi:hypothetical protein
MGVLVDTSGEAFIHFQAQTSCFEDSAASTGMEALVGALGLHIECTLGTISQQAESVISIKESRLHS